MVIISIVETTIVCSGTDEDSKAEIDEVKCMSVINSYKFHFAYSLSPVNSCRYQRGNYKGKSKDIQHNGQMKKDKRTNHTTLYRKLKIE